jgi:hypothetical protein
VLTVTRHGSGSYTITDRHGEEWVVIRRSRGYWTAVNGDGYVESRTLADLKMAIEDAG